eukprot:TRINITY_DN16770_c0_g1_i1.p1 TRINITY_DN16770_c0_g1~~TRINITY_DN16770_c0_g1_i1.p1  ORF type:complete len:649 (-),score=130.99 TRINITY_DN16770_c0_g1_i1:106-1995(-)
MRKRRIGVHEEILKGEKESTEVEDSGPKHPSSSASTSASSLDWSLDVLIWIVVCGYALLCPYTKVEESFNVQAMHDLLYHGLEVDAYDHKEFPGVVPRTFIGPLVVTFIPKLCLLLGLSPSKLVMLRVLRIILGTLGVLSLSIFRRALGKSFGRATANIFPFILISQFHFLFYLSRPLPNTFAMILSTTALAFWMEKRDGLWMACLAFAAVVFRSELVLLAFPCFLASIARNPSSLFPMVRAGLITSLFSIGITLAVDSLFWGRWIWPEWEVLWFNTALNKSHLWGTSPFLWYFTSALPRMMLGAFLLLPFSLWLAPNAGRLSLIGLTFVFCYSFLPHKEARFIFYVIPLLNASVSAGLAYLWSRKRAVFHALVGIFLVSAVLTAGFLKASMHNYPGAEALMAMQQKVPVSHGGDHSDNIMFRPYVHMDGAATMTGVSRFLELPGRVGWRYSKNETELEFCKYTHLISAETHRVGFRLMHQQYGFDRIDMERMMIVQAPKVYVLEREGVYLKRKDPSVNLCHGVSVDRIEWEENSRNIHMTMHWTRPVSDIRRVIAEGLPYGGSGLYVAAWSKEGDQTCLAEYSIDLFGEIVEGKLLETSPDGNSIEIGLLKYGTHPWPRLSRKHSDSV